MPGFPGFLELGWIQIPTTRQCFLEFSIKVDGDVLIEEPGSSNLLKDEVLAAPLLLRLQQVESRLRTYENHFPGVVFTQRSDFSFPFLSARAESLTGLPISRLQRSTQAFTELIHPVDRARVLEQIQENRTRGGASSLEYRIINKITESVTFVRDIRLPIVTASGQHLQDEGFWLDITRQAIAEDRIGQAIWKENLATITSGLVHDFSNMMAGIYALTDLYHNEMPTDHPRYEGMSKVKANAMKAQHLVRRIVDLNREAAGERNFHNLEVLIREQLDIIKTILPRSARVSLKFPDEEMLVYLDEVGFRRSLIHLMTNARDAIEATGEVGFEVECRSDGLLLHVWDSGPGIDPTLGERVFEPFVSTKSHQSAAGFGLYSVRQFIETEGGSIALGDGRYGGAHFELFFPSNQAPGTRYPAATDETIGAESHSRAHATHEKLHRDARNVATPSIKPKLWLIAERPDLTDLARPFLESPEWELQEFSDAATLAVAYEDSEQSPGAIIWLGAHPEAPPEFSSLAPLLPFADEVMLALFFPGCRTGGKIQPPEPFDLLLDGGSEPHFLQQRLHPWIAP